MIRGGGESGEWIYGVVLCVVVYGDAALCGGSILCLVAWCGNSLSRNLTLNLYHPPPSHLPPPIHRKKNKIKKENQDRKKEQSEETKIAKEMVCGDLLLTLYYKLR